MASHIWTSLVILIYLSQAVFAKDYICEDVKIQSLIMKNESESRTDCFHRGMDLFFISENCSQMKCDFIEKIKTTTFDYRSTERPGRIQCSALGGVVEKIKIENRTENLRCIFYKDQSFISLSLLESWDGLKFAGKKNSD